MRAADHSRALIILVRLLLMAALFALALAALHCGLDLRRWAWDQTDPIHFYPDMNNGVHWGSQGNEPADRPRGFLNVYDLVADSAERTSDDSPAYGLDYAPLRLLLITRWQNWAARSNPEMMQAAIDSRTLHYNRAWHPPYAFYAPLLRFNDATEIAAAVGLFLLARHWVRRGDKRWGSTSPARTWGAVFRPFRGCFAGALAATLFWFNPAIILSAHGWPTWDEWIIPFFVWTLWLCCVDCWLAAGVVLAVGAMFKGQQLFVAPMFVLWPILAGRPLAALRWLAGLALGIALIASPWLLTYFPDGVTTDTLPADRKLDFAALALVAYALIVIAIPSIIFIWMRRRGDRQLEDNALGRFHRATEKVVPWLRPVYAPFAALILAASLLLSARWFHGNLNWLYIGWGYGTRHYLGMVTGLSDNLAGLLCNRFGWNDLTDIAFTLNPHAIRLWPTHTEIFADPTTITIRALLVSLYVIFFIICIIGMVVQYRRNDPRFLVAVTAAWIMFFTFLPQIHERYLLYGAGVGCALTAVGTGFVLLDILLTCQTFMMTLHVMMSTAAGAGSLRMFARQISPTFSVSLLKNISRTYPDFAWALLLCAAIFLYHAIAPSPPPRQHD